MSGSRYLVGLEFRQHPLYPTFSEALSTFRTHLRPPFDSKPSRIHFSTSHYYFESTVLGSQLSEIVYGCGTGVKIPNK